MKQLAILALALCPALIPAYSATAKVSGPYVFVEQGTGPNGQAVAALAMLTFADGGSVVGRKMMAAATGVQQIDLQGSFTLNADNTGMLTMSSAVTDADGNSSTNSDTYELLISQEGDINALHTNNSGYFTVAKLTAATPNGLKGVYSFAESAEGRPFARIVQLKFDGAGNVGGYQILQSQTLAGQVALSGAVQDVPSGFGSLVLQSASTDADGNTTGTTENYMYLSTPVGVKMLRTDAGQIGVVDLTQ